ncbi:MAG: hypothetical protein LBL90_05585 [Prevotellaceae bacterium]|jgi:hypothetical protein|nr:hypothetical protein [Prevotellaceae bacterium]
MKKLVLFMLALIFTMGAIAQDIIIRKDGSETKAKVIEIDSQNIKYKRFENHEGPTYTEPKSDILKIRYQNGTEDSFAPEKITPKADKKFPKLINSKSNVRYACILETGFAISMQTKNTKLGLGYGVTLSQGIAFNQKHFASIGVGFEGEGYIDGNGPYGYIPIFANYRYTLKDNQITPFVSVSAGWRAAVTKTKEINGGLWSNISVGVRFGKLVASIGTFAKTYQYKENINNISHKDTYANLGIMFNIGFSF